MDRTFKAVIFDLDGVLTDTAEYHYRAWKRLADELGVAFDREKNNRLRGVDRMASLAILVEDMDPKPGNLDELAARKNGWYKEMIHQMQPDELLPGVMELLANLRSRGVKIGVASSSKNARTVIERLGIEPALDAIVDGAEFEHAKPAPDVFLICAERLGIKPHECVVLEDAQAGIDAALTAGMGAVAVEAGGPLEDADLSLKLAADLPMELF